MIARSKSIGGAAVGDAPSFFRHPWTRSSARSKHTTASSGRSGILSSLQFWMPLMILESQLFGGGRTERGAVAGVSSHETAAGGAGCRSVVSGPTFLPGPLLVT